MRINVIPVSILSDVHLRAEYREIIMSFHYLRRSTNSRDGIDWGTIPKSYTLNKGHAKFWYNKFQYIHNRFVELSNEMAGRGYETKSITNKYWELYEEVPAKLRNSYVPTYADRLINVHRILERIYIRKDSGYYKLSGNKMSWKDWVKFYTSELGIDSSTMDSMVTQIEQDFGQGLLTKHLL